MVLGLKQVERRRRLIALMFTGLTEKEIGEILGVSDRTVRRDLKSPQVKEFALELLRTQLRDIATADLKDRLYYRNKLLEKLIKKFGLFFQALLL
jgi:transposase